MTGELVDPVDKLKNALAEVREHRALFTEEAFSTIVMSLLDRIRRLQAANVASPADEIRLVTVLFIDVVNSTGMAQAMDTGDFKQMLEEAHRRMANLVVEWDGTIGQYLGDGILAFFGAQRSRGDDAIRCVACALAIQQEIDRFANDVFLSYGVELSIRLGISTGRVVVGMVGTTDRQELLALGPATNLAARLQAEAPPSAIYLDSATQARLRGQFRLQARPLLRVRGFDDPILVYEVLGRRETVASSLVQTSLAALTVPLVGREDVLMEIAADILTALQDARLHVVLLLGDIGMGKSQILQETIDKIEANRVLQLQMVAHHEFQMKPYNLLTDFLTRFCSLAEQMTAAEVAGRILSTITAAWDHPQAAQAAELMGYLAGYGFHDSPYVNRLLAEGVLDDPRSHLLIAQFFRGLIEQTHMPLLLVVDNLQWADLGSVRLLEMLAQELYDCPMVMLTAARLNFDQLYPTFMQNYERCNRILLERLSDDTTRRMIETILKPIERVPAHVVTTIVERAQGNPLFVIEFLAMLFDNGVFHRGRDGRWRFNIVLYDSSYNQLPAGLVEVIQSRLDDIEPDVRQVLQLAAVIGQTFWKSILDELANGDQSDALDLLQIRGIVQRDPETAFEGDPQYSFRHSLYCDVAYEMVPRFRREQLHRQISTWMIGRVAGRPEFFTLLAAQFRAAGETEAALFTYLEATQNHLQFSRYNETLKAVEQALALGRSLPREKAIGPTAQLWTLQAQALMALRRYSEAVASAQSALRLFDEMPGNPLPAQRVAALRQLATAHTALGEYAPAREAITAALLAVDPTDHTHYHAVLIELANLEMQTGQVKLALDYAQQALMSARKVTQPHLLAAVLPILGVIHIDLGRFGQALMCFEEMLEIDKQLGLIREQRFDLRSIGRTYLDLHLYDRAQQAFEAAAKLHDRTMDEDAFLVAFQAVLLARRGDPARAAAQIEKVAASNPPGHFRQYLLAVFWMDVLLLNEEFGRVTEMAADLAERTRSHNALMCARAQIRLGYAQARLGVPSGVALLREALHYEQEHGGRDVVQGYLWLSQVDRSGEDAAYQQAARGLYALARDLAPRSELRSAFLQTPFVQQVLLRAATSTPPPDDD
jgi:class 3 adenylate cyclase/tetratricopeptide (TPR) repeat protein